MILVSVALMASLWLAPNRVEALNPLVDVSKSEVFPEGTHVGVNVPFFYSLSLDTRGNRSGFRLDESVMGGFVKVYLDRKKLNATKSQGPIRVSVGGMTMYDNKASAPSD